MQPSPEWCCCIDRGIAQSFPRTVKCRRFNPNDRFGLKIRKTSENENRMMFKLYELTRRQTAMFAVAAVALVIAVAAAVYSCRFNHTYPKELTAIDSLCESRPDSAMALLEGMPKEVMEGDADRMYYGLLKIKAANNLYMVQKDSTIFHIVDYFEDSGDKEKLRDSYYFLGKYYVEHNDAPQALKCFQTALDMSDEKTPLAFKSKVYSQSGTLFLKQGLDSYALEFYKKSYSCDSVLNDTINMIHGLRDIGQIYRHLNQKDSCELYLKRVSVLAATFGNRYLEHTVSLAMIGLYIEENKIPGALSLLKKTIPYVDKKTVSPAYSAAMEIYSRIHADDSAFVYGKKLLSVGSLYAKEKSLVVLMDYYSKSNDLGNVMKCLKMYNVVSDSIRNTDSEEAVARMHALYDYSLREKENTALVLKNKEKTYYCILFFILLVLLCVSFVLLRIRSKARYARLNGLYEHLGNMYNDVREQSEMQILLKDKKISELTGQLESLDSEKALETDNYKKTILDLKLALGNAVKAEDKRKAKKLAVYEHIRQQLLDGKNFSESAWKEIEVASEYIYPGFKERLFDKCGLDDYEYRICILSKLGFLNSEIAILLNRTQGAITQMRTSLYKKLSGTKGSSKQFDALIKSL